MNAIDSIINELNSLMTFVSGIAMSETDLSGVVKIVTSIKSLLQNVSVEFDNARNKIEELENEVARLLSRLNNNSRNCGSTTAVDRASCTTSRKAIDEEDPENQDDDQEKAANEYNSRDDEQKKNADAGIPKRPVGGQPGHSGTTLGEADVLKLIESLKEQGLEPDIVFRGDNVTGKYKDRFFIGLKVVPYVKIVRCYEQADGTYDFPDNCDSVVTYDTSIHTWINYLRNECNMSDGKIAKLLFDISNGMIHPSVGTVVNSLKYFSEDCATSIDHIIENLLKSDVAYTDATYTFKAGENAYIRNVSNKNVVLYIPMDSKSLEALQDVAVLPDYHGILIHDHEIVMYHFGNDHGECIIHVMRYCRKDIDDTGNAFASDLIDLFTEINNRKKELISQGIYSFTEEELNSYATRYDEIVAAGREQNKTTKHNFAKKKELTFLNRLEKYKANHLLFMYNFEVDWCNNTSELDLRKAKRHTAVTGGFRTDNGIKYYCNSLSVIESLKKQKIDLWKGIEWILLNKGNIFDAMDIVTA